jgi:hypothetical protein
VEPRNSAAASVQGLAAVEEKGKGLPSAAAINLRSFPLVYSTLFSELFLFSKGKPLFKKDI